MGRFEGRFRSALRLGVPALAIVSFAYSLYASTFTPEVAYFSTFTRAWELLIGASLALWAPLIPFGPRIATALFLGGLSAIAVSIWFVDGRMPFPGVAALLPTLGAAAMIAAGQQTAANPARAVLESRPSTFVGDISYSLYLWHWPIIVLTSALLGTQALPAWAAGGILVVSLVVAALSKRYIEDAFMRGSRDAEAHERSRVTRIRRHPFVLATGLLALTGVASALLLGNLVRIDLEQKAFVAAAYPGTRVLDARFDPASVPEGEVIPSPTLLDLQQIERQLDPRLPCDPRRHCGHVLRGR